MKSALTLSLLTVSLIALPVLGQESTREDFKEFSQAMQGRWVGEVTWITDWPGVGGRKGEKATCYCEIRTTEDGNAVLGKFLGGGGSGTWLTVYEAGSKQIKETNVTSGGTVWMTTFSKLKDGTWSGIQTGSNPDGSKIEAKLTLTITDDGDTHTWTGTTMIGGKKVDELHDVWRRVSKW